MVITSCYTLILTVHHPTSGLALIPAWRRLLTLDLITLKPEENFWWMKTIKGRRFRVCLEFTEEPLFSAAEKLLTSVFYSWTMNSVPRKIFMHKHVFPDGEFSVHTSHISLILKTECRAVCVHPQRKETGLKWLVFSVSLCSALSETSSLTSDT